MFGVFIRRWFRKLQPSNITKEDFIRQMQIEPLCRREWCFFLCNKKNEISKSIETPDCFYFDFNACYLVINACMNARNAVVAFTHGIRTLPVYTIVISHYITNAQIYSPDSSSVPSDRTKKSSRIQCAHQKICIRASTFFFRSSRVHCIQFYYFYWMLFFSIPNIHSDVSIQPPFLYHACAFVFILRKRFFFLSHFYTL